MATPTTVTTPTLRDMFAMAALAGLLANEPIPQNPERTLQNRSVFAFELADAMLAARG